MPPTPTGRRKVALALGGGGARGFAHLGVAKALRELGVPVCCIAGTSIGSIVGGVIAADRLDLALEWADKPDWFKLPQLFLKLHLPRRALLGTERIESFLRRMIGAETFAGLAVPFAAVATDLFTGETVAMREGDVQTAIRASMSIPGVFEPVARDGRVLVDGGLSDPVPVDVCRAMGADAVIAVDLNVGPASRPPVPLDKLNLLGIIDQTFTVVCNRVGQEVLAQNRPDVILRPPVWDVKMLDFRDGGRLVDIGYRVAMEQRDELLALC